MAAIPRAPAAGLLAALALAACNHAPLPVAEAPPQAPPAPSAEPAPAPTPPVVEAPPPPARWALAYRRACNGSVTAPILSVDAASVTSCDAVFEVARGRFLGRGDASCQHYACPEPALLVVDQGTPRLLDARLAGLRAAALAAGGDLAAVVRADGSAALVALPSGESLAPLPAQGDAAVGALAVSPKGDRVAVGVDGHLRVYARHGAGFVEVLDDTRGSTSSLAFAADGRSLFAGDALAVYREGAEARTAPALPYEVTLPPGFEKLVKKDDGIGFKNSDSRTWALREGLVAMFGEARHGASVTVLALDPDELGSDGDAATWGRRVAERVLPGWSVEKTPGTQHATMEAWGDEPGSRSVELHAVAHGCEDAETFHRVVERDGALYDVHLEIEGVLGKKRITPWLRAFLDAPLGAAPSRSRVAPPAERHAKRKRPRKKARK